MPTHDSIIDKCIADLFLPDTQTILEVGFSYGETGYMLRTICKFKGYMVGLEIFRPHIQLSKRFKIYDDFVLGDARFLPFKKTAFDAIFTVEVIEHLSKSDGLKFIDQCESVAKRSIIITTPRGFVYQEGKENAFETHKSGYSEKDFNSYGFSCRFVGKPTLIVRRLKVVNYVLGTLLTLMPKIIQDKLPKEQIVAFKIETGP